MWWHKKKWHFWGKFYYAYGSLRNYKTNPIVQLVMGYLSFLTEKTETGNALIYVIASERAISWKFSRRFYNSLPRYLLNSRLQIY